MPVYRCGHFLTLLTILATLLATRPLDAQSSAVDTTAVLAPGDVVRIAVWRRLDLSGEFVVAPDGSISHPLYREVKVTGIPIPTVEERVRTFLVRFGESNPAVSVYALLRVFVGGEVRLPNVYTLPPGTTVAQAVAAAGGPSASGMQERVEVSRDPGTFTVDLTRPDPSTSQVVIRSGDRITVARRRSFVQDRLAPWSSILGAAASVVSIIVLLRTQRP
jgi:polysaccharide export outer membrane protein